MIFRWFRHTFSVDEGKIRGEELEDCVFLECVFFYKQWWDFMKKCATKLIALVKNSNTCTFDSAFYMFATLISCKEDFALKQKLFIVGVVLQIASFFLDFSVFCPCILQHSLYLIQHLRPTAMTGGFFTTNFTPRIAKKCDVPHSEVMLVLLSCVFSCFLGEGLLDVYAY